MSNSMPPPASPKPITRTRSHPTTLRPVLSSMATFPQRHFTVPNPDLLYPPFPQHTMSTVSSPLSTYSSTATSSPSGSPPPTLKRAASVAFSSHPPSPSASDISSDTSGSVPGSPGLDAHDEEHAEQITVCRWDGCGRDLGDMDHLVKHIHDDHIGTRKATYACQWDDCTRKGMAHASGYALRAHMRSHTKEKPFYCSLPGELPHLLILRVSTANWMLLKSAIALSHALMRSPNTCVPSMKPKLSAPLTQSRNPTLIIL